MFERFFLRFFFKSLYKKFVNQGWALISNAPRSLNIALPDFLVVYRIASFSKKDHVEVYGHRPENCSYFSFTVYDQLGLPVSSINDSEIFGNPFHLVVGRDLPQPDDDYYCLIYRVYRTNKKEIPSQPILVVNGKNILPVPDTDVFENTSLIARTIASRLEKRDLTIRQNFDFFCLPASSKMSGLFPNRDARYLVLFPKTDTLIVSGRFDTTARFTGFMVCDYKTTSTFDTLTSLDMPKRYTFWVSTSLRMAIKRGYQQDSCPLLLWPPTPMLVYREVRVDSCRGLFDKKIRENDWESARRVMGVYYPKVEYCGA